jgi:DHA1 family bicyclomycin/chloramphenicol resistance-like MFS transporter
VAPLWVGGVIGFIIGIAIFVAMNGFVGANAVSGELASVDHGTGAASALLGFAQYGGGMVGSALVGALACALALARWQR